MIKTKTACKVCGKKIGHRYGGANKHMDKTGKKCLGTGCFQDTPAETIKQRILDLVAFWEREAQKYPQTKEACLAYANHARQSAEGIK